MLVVTKVCRESSKHNFVATKKVLSRRAAFCRDKHLFVATKVCFAATKLVLVAAPAPAYDRCLCEGGGGGLAGGGVWRWGGWRRQCRETASGGTDVGFTLSSAKQ